MKTALTLVCLFLVTTSAFPSNGDRFKAVPKQAKKITEILKAVNKVKGFGSPSWAMYSLHAGEIRHFAIWFCPFSGRAATYTHSYRHDGKQWKLMRSDLFEKTHTITVGMSKKGFIYRNFQGGAKVMVLLVNVGDKAKFHLGLGCKS